MIVNAINIECSECNIWNKISKKYILKWRDIIAVGFFNQITSVNSALAKEITLNFSVADYVIFHTIQLYYKISISFSDLTFFAYSQ